MNRLWVRMQHLSSGNKDKEQREAERSELRVTVGENIIRLGNLEGLTYEVYRSVVLPKILDIVVICKDPMAQQYLMDCIIQVFPDEYHL
jgi:vacuolar protein sorting-associated protein 35